MNNDKPDLLMPCKIKNGLKTNFIGREMIYSTEMPSTNDLAKEIAENNADEGAVVIAEKQSSGRGRKENVWSSPEGGIWFSIILRPKINPPKAVLLTQLTALAVTKSLREKTGVSAEIKWPNDILVGGKKICGILTEMNTENKQINYIIIGVGINVNNPIESLPGKIQQNTTSLIDEKGRIKRIKLLQHLLQNIEKEYLKYFLKKRSGNFCEFISEVKNFSCTLNKYVNVKTAGGLLQGKVVDIAKSGALILLTQNGETQKVFAGSVTIQNSPLN